MNCKRCGNEFQFDFNFCPICGHPPRKPIERKTTVPEPRQLPSGNWHIQIKRPPISVTEPTKERCKLRAIRALEQWYRDDAKGLHSDTPVRTLQSVIDLYIEANQYVLRPATINGYRNIRGNRFKKHMDDDVTKLNPQQIVNDEIQLGIKPKTISNAWSLASSALRYSSIPFTPPKLPTQAKPDKQWLDYEEIQVFLHAIEGESCELGALLGLHSLRKSEIFGLKRRDCDLTHHLLRIRGTYISTTSGWVYDSLTKTKKSRRDVPIIIPRLEELLNEIPEDQEFVIGLSNKNLYRQINAICRKNGLPEIGVHGLRHSFASLAYHLGWKKLTTMDVGGWENSRTLDEIYTHNADFASDISLMKKYYSQQHSTFPE